VQQEVADIIKGRIVIGHSLENDFKALFLTHPFKYTRDTAKYRPLQRSKGRPHALRYLAKTYLDMTIQTGEHNPEEDAQAALYLYKHFAKEWEAKLAAKRKRKFKKKQQHSNTSTAANSSKSE
jgi:RNA exonuclease 4